MVARPRERMIILQRECKSWHGSDLASPQRMLCTQRWGGSADPDAPPARILVRGLNAR